MRFVRSTRAGDIRALARFVRRRDLGVSFIGRLRIAAAMLWTTLRRPSPHLQREILAYIETILTMPRGGRGVVVEAGCFKGSSTAKFSRAAAHAGRTLVVFDSFEGIPENDEAHDKNIFGFEAKFGRGDYAGGLEEVKSTVRKFGRIDACRFVKGWFDDTMPGFTEPVAAAYIDVDLASSTRTCLKFLFPLLEPGGVIYSQDGHLPLVIEVLEDDAFWRDEVGVPRPEMVGLRTNKLVKIVKPEE